MSLTKTIKKTVKREMKRNINWGFTTKIEVFDYGHYSSKDVDFDKFGNLNDIGISFDNHEQTEVPSDETFSKSKSTTIDFEVTNDGKNLANLSFGKNASFISEGYQMVEHSPKNFASVVKQIVEKWKADSNFWRNDYVLVYSTTKAEGYTLVVSKGRNVNLSLESSISLTTNAFNIGKPELNLQASGNMSKSYRAIGKTGTIFFEMYRIGKDRKGYYYKEYGRGKRKKRL